MRLRVEEVGGSYRVVGRGFVRWFSAGEHAIALRLVELSRKHRLGMWQTYLLADLLKDGEIPASAARLVHGSASEYTGRYQVSLDKMAKAVGAKYVPGPRGGRWLGKWVLEGGESK